MVSLTHAPATPKASVVDVADDVYYGFDPSPAAGADDRKQAIRATAAAATGAPGD